MKTEWILIIVFAIFSSLGVYCFLFQRTVRKIRQFAFGTDSEYKQFEKYLYPEWYFVINIISKFKYIPLLWLLYVNWPYAIVSYAIIGILQLILPVNDYSHTQLIKRFYLNKIDKGFASEFELEIYEAILEVEKKTI